MNFLVIGESGRRTLSPVHDFSGDNNWLGLAWLGLACCVQHSLGGLCSRRRENGLTARLTKNGFKQ
jgi:hypothetical protein